MGVKYIIYAGNETRGIATEQKGKLGNLVMYYLTHGYDSVKIEKRVNGKVYTEIKTRVN